MTNSDNDSRPEIYRWATFTPSATTFTPTLIARGRQAALDAWDAMKAAEVWALDRSLDPPAPSDQRPAAWSEVSVLTVSDAEIVLDWLK